MKIEAYRLHNNVMRLDPATPSRDWMDKAINKNPYRCLPLVMANTYGWQIISSSEFTAEWDGGPYPNSIKIENISGINFPTSHFGEGVLTWHTGYIFKTEYPYGLYVCGSPNQPIHNIICLSGIVETHWLPFPFTMNWRFTAPGKIKILKDTVIAHIYPIQLDIFSDIQAEIKNISDNPQLNIAYKEWSRSRADFLKGDRSKKDWQKNYFKGVDLNGVQIENHITNPNVPKFHEI